MYDLACLLVRRGVVSRGSVSGNKQTKATREKREVVVIRRLFKLTSLPLILVLTSIACFISSF